MADGEETWDTAGKVQELRAAMGAKLSAPPGDALNDEHSLRRFLRARQGNVDAAADMLTKHLEWRARECPWWPAKNVPLDLVVRACVVFNFPAAVNS